MDAALSPTPNTIRTGRHVPERSCVACRRKRPQGEFLRLVKVAGVWALKVGVRSGRGAYLCADSPGCWAEKRLRRTFGAQAAAISAALLGTSSPDSPQLRRTKANSASHQIQHAAME